MSASPFPQIFSASANFCPQLFCQQAIFIRKVEVGGKLLSDWDIEGGWKSPDVQTSCHKILSATFSPSELLGQWLLVLGQLFFFNWSTKALVGNSQMSATFFCPQVFVRSTLFSKF